MLKARPRNLEKRMHTKVSKLTPAFFTTEKQSVSMILAAFGYLEDVTRSLIRRAGDMLALHTNRDQVK